MHQHVGAAEDQTILVEQCLQLDAQLLASPKGPGVGQIVDLQHEVVGGGAAPGVHKADAKVKVPSQSPL